MAVTTSSITLTFNVGEFGQTTGIAIPPAEYEDKITFNKVDVLNRDLVPDFLPDGDSGNIYILCRMLFNGFEVYKHPQFDTNWAATALSTAPTDPTAIAEVTNFLTSPVETFTQNVLLPIQTDVSGNIVQGTYTIYFKYVYPQTTGNWVVLPITYTVPFAFTELAPQLTYWYDTSIPILSVTDGQSYINGSTQAERTTEFDLTFPLNYGSETDELENIQTITYDTFYTQANELVYTILINYQYSTHNVLNVQQQYKTLNVIYVDRCVIYDCLKTLYDQWVAQSCSTAANNRIYNQLQQANILANLIINGLGCNSEDLSGLIVQFNTIAGCDCGCNDTTLPRLLQATS